MKKGFVFFVCAMLALSGALAFGDTQLQIARLESRVNAGFRERIYVDGKNVLTLANGRSGTVTVSDGPHRIYAELSTLKTSEVAFNTEGGVVTISVAANSLENFVISIGGAAMAASSAADLTQSALGGLAQNTTARSAPAAAPPQRAAGQGNLESALNAGAAVILARLSAGTTVAVLSVASQDKDAAEFVVDELAYIIVSSGKFKVVDRKSLDAIKSEQAFQTSGDVDDDSAVSIGMMLGADIVITGSISGGGSTRRLRLKALNVKTAEIAAMASEAF
ncbi:MAG: CsgG/HfaB family protein [Treponema sp.]|jgi:lysophospholipase L1-like esterase|nr:CsgG/HfaB family protein [Treponema sp.]